MDWLKFIEGLGADIWTLIQKYFGANAKLVQEKLTPYLQQSKEAIAKWTGELASGKRTPESYKNAMLGQKAVMEAEFGYATLISEQQFQSFLSDLAQLLIDNAKKLV